MTGLALLGYVQHIAPNLSPNASLLLDFHQDLSEDKTLAALVILSTGLKYIWESRVNKKVVATFKMRAEIEARVSILRRTRHKPSCIFMDESLLSV